MSGAGEAVAPPPRRGAEAGSGRPGAPAAEKCDKENTERDVTHATNSCFTHGETHDQSTWGNCSDDKLIRTQPQRLPQLQMSAQEPSEEEIVKIKNGHTSLSNGNGIHHGAKHVSADNRRLSAPVTQKMHRKLQSSLSVNSDISKKSKVNAVFSQKTGSSPEDCCVHCILACLFCEFLTLCNIVLGRAACGICTSEACCCCCGEEMGDDCSCPCDMDCGIMDACCESSDCLEISFSGAPGSKRSISQWVFKPDNVMSVNGTQCSLSNSRSNQGLLPTPRETEWIMSQLLELFSPHAYSLSHLPLSQVPIPISLLIGSPAPAR
ncbi:MyoD family inhibitor domain-containing protein [Manis javanica]|nr:MyoD family inhibitor domain-containing protein [Manis javanica]